MVNKFIEYTYGELLLGEFLGAIVFPGDVTVGGDLTVVGSSNIGVDETVTGDFQVDGNSTFGDAYTDLITINGRGLFADGTAALPSISFSSDLDLGFYYSSDSTVKFSSAGSEVFTMDKSGLSGVNANAFAVLNDVASDTNPTLLPDRSDLDTGVGHQGADALSLIAGGVEGLRITEDTTAQALFANGTAAKPSMSFINDPNTGFYWSTADTINIANNGAIKWSISENYLGSNTNAGARIKFDGVSSTAPTLIPRYDDTDTGIGWTAADQLSLIAGGVEGLRITEDTTTQVLFGDGTAAKPSVSFISDPDTGFYSIGANVIGATLNGTRTLSLSTNGLFSYGSGSNQGGILAEVASAINPNIIPLESDLDTGIGLNAADELSLIAGGSEGLRIDANESEVQPMMTLAVGPMDLEEDSGAVTVMNLPVSATPSDGDEESMTFAIDSNPVLKVKGSADGSGGADDFQVIVGQTLGSAALPSLAFGDGNTGFYESADNTLTITNGGSPNWHIKNTILGSSSGSQCVLIRETASDTNPNILPDESDKDTGIGRNAADQLSLIAGGVEAARCNATNFQTQNGIIRNTTTVNAATYDLLTTDDILLVTYTQTNPMTSLTLPTAQTVDGRTIIIKDAGGNAGTNNITIDTQASEEIDGSATLVINSDYNSVTLVSDGTDWFII